MTRPIRPIALSALGMVIHSLWTTALAADPDLYGFLAGTYAVIGKAPDSDRTYSGTILFEETEDALRVVRSVGTTKIVGTGKLEKALHGEVDVLRVRFSEQGKNFEATYLIKGDLDNYARLTGYVYAAGGGTERVGLEALFADNGRLDRH